MKKSILFIFISALSFSSFAQVTLSPAERAILIQQIKQELLDSLRAGNTEVVSTDDSIKAEKAKPWKGTLELSGYVEAYYLYDFGQPQTGNRADLYTAITAITSSMLTSLWLS
jgi:hypothetical protein